MKKITVYVKCIKSSDKTFWITKRIYPVNDEGFICDEKGIFSAAITLKNRRENSTFKFIVCTDKWEINSCILRFKNKLSEYTFINESKEPAIKLSRVEREDIVTPRGLHVLEEISCGYSNEEIAARLGISVRTVENTIKVIVTKLKAKSMRHAVYLACCKGLLELE